jgi:hypothetical protein
MFEALQVELLKRGEPPAATVNLGQSRAISAISRNVLRFGHFNPFPSEGTP